MTDVRFLTGFRKQETDTPGLLLEDDGTVWLVLPDGSRVPLAPSGVGLVNKGATILDFGVFPGQSDATVTVAGQTGIEAGSAVFVGMRPADSADHTADEHIVETMQVYAKDIVPGVGFTIHGVNKSEINEPAGSWPHQGNMQQSTATAVTWRQETRQDQTQRPAHNLGSLGTRVYGEWNVGWMWV